MKLTVLNWFKDASIALIGRTIEILFRIVLFFLPLGLYLTLIQSRSKASTIRNISIYTNDESRWQHVFPGFILVAVDPNNFRKNFEKVTGHFQAWVANNKYLLAMLFMITIITLMLINGKV